MSDTWFADRHAAGRRLGERLMRLKLEAPVIFALLRGGAPVAVEIARMLAAPLEVLLVRKIGAPDEPELALGAVVDGAEPHLVVNETVRSLTGAGQAYLKAAMRRELAEIERRRSLYPGAATITDIRGRTAVVVDDGLATGSTARAAVEALRARGTGRIVVAAPVASQEAEALLRPYVDDLVVLAAPPRFSGVGQFYGDFHQLDDDEVIGLLNAARAPARAAGSTGLDPPQSPTPRP
ncbi:phosphoribosyltransferase [Caulobacter sp. CCUG 60055]|uniref:phosphoribosyltransferase n=1 Tax=Caulobacter sp. CCUG 60055 TaxID=2100090 RepID=UPI001FA6CE33|nr:phosphoribosyltransferase family protein [Caulobacter sp. CCUG 60055]MCI3179217.1 phosphoribosyltransferase [Caulobacter sp. CCUG 60055]